MKPALKRIIDIDLLVPDVPPKLNFTDIEWAAGVVAKRIFNLRTTPYHYWFGAIYGIYAKTDDGKDIITVDSIAPHNGHFELFLDELEKYAARTGERIAFCAFMNEKLYRHIRKRPNWGNALSTMDRLEYYPPKAQETAK